MRPSSIRWSRTCSGIVLSLLLGCSGESAPAAGTPALDETGSLDHKDVPEPCLDPTQTNCPCADPGARIECGDVHELRGEYVICSLGTRTCSADGWSACTPEQMLETSAAEVGATPGGLRLQALSTGTNCLNLCDPRCIKHVDTPAGLSVDADLQADASGLTLTDRGSGGNCSSITVTPPTSTFTITDINTTNGAITVTPATLAFAATCSGIPTQPRWSIDAYDRAMIDANGTVTPFSGIGSPILVTATSLQDASTALIDVRVRIEDTGGASAAVTTAFSAASLPPAVLPADAGKTLYPYKNTIFPLDLKAPLVQWDPASQAATETRVVLRYPANSASPTFWYSKIFKNGGTEPKDGTLNTAGFSWQIPQQIWSAFDHSAAGSAGGGEILIQRRYASSVHEMKIPVKFATESIPGTVYYTQYRRQFVNACPTAAQNCNFNPAAYSIGQTCEVGSGTHPSYTTYPATLRAIDLSQRSAPNNDPFASSNTKCPVCHSVSANGKLFTTASQGWVQLGNQPQPIPGVSIDSIGLSSTGVPKFSAVGNAISPTYTGLSDTGGLNDTSNNAGDPFNNHERVGENSRGFSYSAITPDGSYVLQGASFWGNTQDLPASSSTQNAALTGLASPSASKPYFFARTDQPGVGVQFATTGSLPGNSFSAGTFTGSSGSLTVDGYTLTAVDQSVLVKNQASQEQNGVYRLSQVSPWKLTRRYDANTAAELSQYTEVRVSDGKDNRGRVFYVSSASPATLDTDKIQFSERVRPVSFTASPLDVDYATAGALPGNNLTSASPSYLQASGNGVLSIDNVAVITGKSVLVKDEASGASNGIYTVSSAGSATTKWKLVRRLDADQSSEFTYQKEVRVGAGTSNAGKVFYLATSGTITLDSTDLSFKLQLLPTMMVPVISPDGSKIVYVNGDSDTTPGLPDTGWRKGLSMLQFEQDTLSVAKKTRLLNSWPAGPSYSGIPFKWPFFESDSRSLLYVETETGEYCSAADANRSASSVNTDSARACMDGAYGSMSPTTRGYWKGKIYSLDTAATIPANTRVELSKLNDADDDSGTDDAVAADHNYQPTVLPFAKGGYRWVIFTTTRAYGNQLNQYSGSTPTHFTCATSALWMAAIDDTTAATSDRSHPAFLLPGQNLLKITDTTTPHYINERGFLVPTPCKGSGLSCSNNSDCCGGGGSNPSAACLAPTTWTPASGPPAKTCGALPSTCSDLGQSCNTPDDCCNGAACVNFLCAQPPNYQSATYERTYDAACPDSYQPTWQLLSYYLTTGSDSQIQFSVQTANDSAALDAAPVLSVGSSSNDVVSPATPDFQDVGKVLRDANSNGLNHLRVIFTLVPSTDKKTAPILHDWEMRYTCEAAQ